MLIIAPSAGERSFLSFSLTHWLPVGRFGGQLIFSLEGTTAFNMAHIFDFPLSLLKTCRFSPTAFTVIANSDCFIQQCMAQTADAEVLVSKLHKTMSGSACDDDFHHTL